MKMRRWSVLLLAAIPSAAFAHSGHEAKSLSDGLAHPLSGADHLLAMIAVGLIAAIANGKARWVWPLSFITAMLAGFVVAGAGVALPHVEPVILASVIVLGLIATLSLRVPLTAGFGMVALFGFAHGQAHGVEAGSGNALLFVSGFVTTTALLHVAGLALGSTLRPGWQRATGTATFVAGLAMAVA
jgi:urease accessory protein